MKTQTIELTFTESSNPEQKPIARYNGKLCLVVGDFLCPAGETWQCEVISDKISYFFVRPLFRLKKISDNIKEFNRKVEGLKEKFNYKIEA